MPCPLTSWLGAVAVLCRGMDAAACMGGGLQVDSLEDMRRFVMEHSDFQMLQGNVSKHVNLVSALSAIISKRNLMELSQVRPEAGGPGAARRQQQQQQHGGGEGGSAAGTHAGELPLHPGCTAHACKRHGASWHWRSKHNWRQQLLGASKAFAYGTHAASAELTCWWPNQEVAWLVAASALR